jgi:DNA-binding protein HU-beta
MVTRDEFIERLSQKGYTKRDAGIVMDDFIRTLEEALVGGESVMFHGFGTFEVRERAERESSNPQTKERIVIPSYRAAHFTPGKKLKREIKEGLVRD